MKGIYESGFFAVATSDDIERFENACKIVSEFESRFPAEVKLKKGNRGIGIEGGTNIGGLSEKSLHLVMKYFLEENRDYHEVGVLGRYYADILRDGEAIEIQTRSFYSIRKKVEALSGVMPLTIVHPIVCEKTLIRIDDESGEMSGYRKSPSKRSLCDVFRELYGLGELVSRDNISYLFPVVSCNEYKLTSSKSKNPKRDAVKQNITPTQLHGCYRFASSSCFAELVPKELCNKSFTVAELSQTAKMPYKSAYYLLTVLCRIGKAVQIGKEKRKNLYSMADNRQK